MNEQRGLYTSQAPTGDAESPAPLLGAITGYAKDVQQHIRRVAVSARMKDFLLEMHTRSFGNAGYQRRAGMEQPGCSCPFSNAEWARELDMSRQSLYRLRTQAVTLGIVRYEPDAGD